MGEWTADEQREHRKIWVAALRSGKYRQGKMQLRTAEGMCCLGVACEISNLGEWDGDGGYCTPADHYDRMILPAEVRDWLGLRSADGKFGQGHERRLTVMNDGGASFDKIADKIDAEPEGLLTKAAS